MFVRYVISLGVGASYKIIDKIVNGGLEESIIIDQDNNRMFDEPEDVELGGISDTNIILDVIIDVIVIIDVTLVVVVGKVIIGNGLAHNLNTVT